MRDLAHRGRRVISIPLREAVGHNGRGVNKTLDEGAMLTRDILFGMNLLTLAGFAVMGLSLTLRRMAAAGGPLSIGLMLAGTALVFLGLYAGSG